MQVQRDAVRVAEAEALMASGEATKAARLFGSIMTPHPPFEDVALRLVDTGMVFHVIGTMQEGAPGPMQATCSPEM